MNTVVINGHIINLDNVTTVRRVEAESPTTKYRKPASINVEFCAAYADEQVGLCFTPIDYKWEAEGVERQYEFAPDDPALLFYEWYKEQALNFDEPPACSHEWEPTLSRKLTCTKCQHTEYI